MKTTVGSITATGSANGLSPALNLSPPDSAAVFGVSGTHTGVTMVAEGRLVGGSIWYPILIRDRKTGTSYNGSVSPSTNSTDNYIADVRGYGDVRWYASAGTLTAVTAEVTTGGASDFGGTGGSATVDQVYTGAPTYNAGITFGGATGINTLAMPDNLAEALAFKEGSNTYLSFTTTNGSEAVNVTKNQVWTDGTTVTFSGTTTGVSIGGASDKLAFFGGTPATRPGAFTQTYATASATVAAVTSHTITDNSAGTPSTTAIAALADGTTYANDVAAIRNNFATIAAELVLVKADLLAMKKNDNSIIDALQAVNLAG